MSTDAGDHLEGTVSEGLPARRGESPGPWTGTEPPPHLEPARIARLSPVAAIAIATLSVGVLAVAASSIAGLRNFSDVGYPDSATLLRVGEFVHSGKIYPDFRAPPYLVSLYGPLTYVLLGIPYTIAETMGVEPRVALKLGVFAAWCACLVLVFFIGRRVNRSATAGLVSALFAASLLPMAGSTTQLRGDFPALAFSLLSIYLLLRAGEHTTSAGAIIAAGAALLVKQTFVAVPVGITVWLLWGRHWRAAAVWAVSIAGLVAAGYAVAWYREPLFADHLAALRRPIFEFREVPEILGEAVRQLCVPFAIVGGLAAVRRRTAAASLPVAVALSSWLVAVATIPQVGGSINYFWEPLCISAVLAATGLLEIHRRVGTAPPLVTALVTILLLGWAGPLVTGDLAELKAQYRAARSFNARRATWLRFSHALAGHRLLSSDSPIAILSSTPEMPDPYVNSILNRGGIWSFQPVLSNIAAHRYEAIVLVPGQTSDNIGYRGIQIWSDEMWSTITREYRLACVAADREIWLPRDAANDLCAALRR